MKTSTSIFFILVFVLSVPFYILGTAGAKLPGLPFLPASALMGFVPLIAALVLTNQQRGSEGALTLLKSIFVSGPNLRANWILVTLLFMPTICLLEFEILRLMGSSVPNPQIAPVQAIFYFVAFFIGAIGEELGWQGYAYPSLGNRHTVFGSALILGIIWALWHVIPFVQMGRSTNWIVWQLLSTVALRFIIVWLYENTGKSILIAVLFHTMINLTWALFPIAGSFYDPFVTFLILAFAVSAILAWWRPQGKFGENP
jgi:uncharacterized protein